MESCLVPILDSLATRQTRKHVRELRKKIWEISLKLIWTYNVMHHVEIQKSVSKQNSLKLFVAIWIWTWLIQFQFCPCEFSKIIYTIWEMVTSTISTLITLDLLQCSSSFIFSTLPISSKCTLYHKYIYLCYKPEVIFSIWHIVATNNDWMLFVLKIENSMHLTILPHFQMSLKYRHMN